MNLDDGIDIREAATLAQEEIRDQGLQSCDVALTRFDDSWVVECTIHDSGVLGKRLREFRVDAATGQIMNEIEVE